MAFLIIKALHIVAIVSWMAALLYLPRLFVYHVGASERGELASALEVMEKRLLQVIATPAMIAVILSGFTLLILDPAIMSAGWMHTKLLFVALLIVYHFYLASRTTALAKLKDDHSALFYRILNEVPTVALIVIALLAVVKPF